MGTAFAQFGVCVQSLNHFTAVCDEVWSEGLSEPFRDCRRNMDLLLYTRKQEIIETVDEPAPKKTNAVLSA